MPAQTKAPDTTSAAVGSASNHIAPSSHNATWQELLERAAAQYLTSREGSSSGDDSRFPAPVDQQGVPLDEASIFTAQAFRTITSLVQKRKASEETDSERSETPRLDPGGFSTLETNPDALECKPKKPKRKRSKRRVGH